MSSSKEFARESVDKQMRSHSQPIDANFICGPKPLVMAMKYLRYGCVGGWSAQTVATVVLGFLPTLQQRALRKREKLNVQGRIWLPTVMPALLALDAEIQSHAELSLAVSPLLSKILQGASDDLGNFICIFITALQKVPFPAQQKVILPAAECMLANNSDLLFNMFASDDLSACPWAKVMAPTRVVVTPNNLKNGMKVHFKCMGIPSSKAQNLRIHHNGHVAGNGCFGARATWIVGLVGEHDGAPVVTLHADMEDQPSYLHVSDNGTFDGRGAGGSDCEFLVLSQGDSCISLQSHSKPSLRLRIAEIDASVADAQFHFTMLSASPAETIKSIAGSVAKHVKLHVANLKMQNSTNAKASSRDDSLIGISASALTDGCQVHFQCMSMQDKEARNLRVGEDGRLEGCGRRGPRATWSVGIVGQHEDAPVVTLSVNIRGQVSYLRVAEDGKKIDGRGTGGSSCHFIVRTHNHSCVELECLAAPSVKVRIGVSGQILDPDTTCGDAQQFRFTILSGANFDKSAWRRVDSREVYGKIKQATGGDFPLPKFRLGPEEIQNGMKIQICCLGRTGNENRNLRVRSDGDVEGRGGFGGRATWTVHAVDQRKGTLVLALQAHIDGQSWYLRSVDNGTRIDGRGTGGPDCLFTICVSGQGGTVGLHSLMWPHAKLTVGMCGKLLDPLMETACDNQTFQLLRACHATRQFAGKASSEGDKILCPTSLEDGLRVHLRCMSMQSKTARNLRVAEDGGLEGHGGTGPRATWSVGLVGNHEGAPIITLCVHIKGQTSYLGVSEDGKAVDGRGKGDASCHFTVTTQSNSCVSLRSLSVPSVMVCVGSSSQALDSCKDCWADASAQFCFTLLSAVPQHPAHKIVHVARSIAQAQVESHQTDLPIKRHPTSCPLAPSTPNKKLEVLSVHTLRDGLRVHLQCNGRSGAQRQNLRLCATGDVEGLGMFGNPATWTLRKVGKHNGCPIVTLHAEWRGVPHFLRAATQGHKIDGRGQGGVDCHFIVKTLHAHSSVGLHPVVSPLARLGVGADGKLLDPFAQEIDLHFSFSFLLHSDLSDWQFVEETKNPVASSADQTIEPADKAIQQEWNVMDSKEGQSGDDW